MTRTVVAALSLMVCASLALGAPPAELGDGFPHGGKLEYGEYGRPATLDPITSNDMVGLRLS